MESGVSLSPSRLAPHHFVNLVGASVGCNDWDSAKKLQCFRKLDAESLFNGSLAVEDALGGGMILTPVVEKAFGFLPDLPIRMWGQKKFNRADTIRGFNSAESGGSIVYRDPKIPFTNKSFVDGMTQFFRPYGIIDKDRIIQEMLEVYLGTETKDKRTRLMSYVHAKGDIDFTGPTLMEANIESRLAPGTRHFVYEFEYRRSLSYTPPWMPATHGGEVPFVFGVNIKPFQVEGKSPSQEDFVVEKQMQTFWTNFAKYGNPTESIPSGAVHWSPYSADTGWVLKVGNVSKVISYRNHKSLNLFLKVIRQLDTEIFDSSIIG